VITKKRVPTKYWRFAYDEAALRSILEGDNLVFPDFKLWPRANNKAAAVIAAELRVGGFIFLANFKDFEKVGTVRGIGKIINTSNESTKIYWKKVVPSWSLTIHKIAAEQWANEAVFCFNTKPVTEFKLGTRAEKLFSRP
jgi:hypothetical protein